MSVLTDKIKEFESNLKKCGVKRLVDSAKVYSAYTKTFGSIIYDEDKYTWSLHFIKTKTGTLDSVLRIMLEDKARNLEFDDYAIYTMNNKSVVIIQYKINK